MRIPIPSNRQSFVLEVTIQATSDCLLGLLLSDHRHDYSHYFRRKVSLLKAEKRTIEIRMPVSPANGILDIYNKQTGDSRGFKLLNLAVKPLPLPAVWQSPERKRFARFAIDFAQKAGYLKAGFFDSPGHEFLIQYLPQITDQWGRKLPTPARINRQFPRIQVSAAQFRGYTIPVRIFILFHEGCHYFLNTRSQTKADLCGLRQYLDLGFPRIEAIYATTQVFNESDRQVSASTVQRTKDIIDFIRNYQVSKKQAA